MSSSDEDGPGGKAPGRAPKPTEAQPAPIERSPRGRIIIRSSSHPPVGERGDARDVSGARALPESERAPAPADDRGEDPEARSKRSTPAERPRRRRKVQAERAAHGVPGVTPPHATGGTELSNPFASSRRNTPEQGADEAAVEMRRAARARKIAISVGVVIAILGTALWLFNR
jgi:hypothetical protein